MSNHIAHGGGSVAPEGPEAAGAEAGASFLMFRALLPELRAMIIENTMPAPGMIELTLTDEELHCPRDWPGRRLCQMDLERRPRYRTGAYSPAFRLVNDVGVEVILSSSDESLVPESLTCSINVHPVNIKYNEILKHLVKLAAVGREFRGFVMRILRCSQLPQALSCLGAKQGQGRPVWHQMLGHQDECNLHRLLRGHQTIWVTCWEAFQRTMDCGRVHRGETVTGEWKGAGANACWLMLARELQHVTRFGFRQTEEMDLDQAVAPHHFLANNLPNLREYYDVYSEAFNEDGWAWVRWEWDREFTGLVLRGKIRGPHDTALVEPRHRVWLLDSEEWANPFDMHARLQNYARGISSRREERFGPLGFGCIVV